MVPNILTEKNRDILLRKSISFSPSVIAGIVCIIDIVAIIIPGFLIGLLYVDINGHSASFYVSVITVCSALTAVLFNVLGLYKFDSIIRPIHQIGKIFLGCGIVFLCFILFIFLIKVSTYFSRFWFFSWFCSAVTLLYISRIFCYRLFYRWAAEGKLARNIVLIGAGEQAKQLLSHLRQLKEPWNKVLGVFDDRLQRTDLNIMGHPLLGETNDLLRMARIYRLDDIIIALPWHADRRIRDIVNKLKELPVPIRLSSDLAGISYMERQSSRLGNALMLDITNKPISGYGVLLKALEDKILGTLILAAVAPIMAIIAIAIKLDSKGPVLFRQKRHGFNNQKFMVYKFRTMIHDPLPEQAFQQATQNDPRVTRIGRFLRRSSLDELPQLFNVLEGTMSLVGPRPHAVAMDEQYAPLIEGYFARHRVKPGITGWAQVCGLRGETQDPKMLKARVEHDIFYIENWNLFFDMKILVMTAFVGFIHKNAY